MPGLVTDAGGGGVAPPPVAPTAPPPPVNVGAILTGVVNAPPPPPIAPTQNVGAILTGIVNPPTVAPTVSAPNVGAILTGIVNPEYIPPPNVGALLTGIVNPPGPTSQRPTGIDETDLPDLDGRGLELFSAFSGVDFVNYVRRGCESRRLDDLAVFANAMAEGIHGGIGDFGTSYGPWQLHKGGALPAKYAKLPDANDSINRWAWGEGGISYALNAMANTSAVGKRGHAAVNALVAEFERPANVSYQQGIRREIYDQLAAMGDPYGYLAGQAHGPLGVSSAPAPPIVKKGKSGVGAVGRWRDLIDVLGKDVPETHDKVKAAANNLIGAFR